MYVVERKPVETPTVTDATTHRGADGSTRHAIMMLLLEHGAMTASALAEELELSSVAVRRHLGILQESGKIDDRDPDGPRGRGRPAKEYVLSEAGRASFGQAYDDLAVAAMTHLVETLGPDAIDDLAAKRLAKVEEKYTQLTNDNPDLDQIEALSQALHDAGYFSSVQAGGQLQLHHCPISQVAAEFPQLCEAEAQFFSRLLETDMCNVTTIATGDLVCRTHVGQETFLANPTRYTEGD